MRKEEVGTDIYIQPICMSSGLGREMNEIFIVLGRYAVFNPYRTNVENRVSSQ